MSKLLRNLSFRSGICSEYPKTSKLCLTPIYLHNSKRLYKFINSACDRINGRQLLPVLSINKRYYSNDYPSHTKVLLPALSPTMDMGTIVSWAKKEGDKLGEGDLLAEIETDKATMGFETPEEGYLAKILIAAGTRDVPIGKLTCIIVENEEDVAAFKNYEEDTTTKSQSIPVQAPSEPFPNLPSKSSRVTSSTTPKPAPSPPLSSTMSKNTDRLFVSPLAKKFAAERGLDLSTIGSGSGIFGSIKSNDLSKAGQKSKLDPTMKISLGEGYEDRPVTSVRGVIAKRLMQSKQTIPHYYLNVDLNLDEIMKLRNKLNEHLEKEGVKLTINDFIVKATAIACKRVPEANSAWMDSFIRQYNVVDVSIAVNSDKGLITPIVFDADKKGLVEISQEIKRLASKAREGKLELSEFQGGTISVSNLGMFNIKSVSSIINLPQSCILGIGSIQQRAVPNKSSNSLTVSQFVQFTLSCDHRVVDGAVGARWLQAFRKLIEEPQYMLL